MVLHRHVAPVWTKMENWSLDYCWSVLAPWKRHLVACGLIAMVLTYILTRFVMTHWYRAQAILRPASQEPQSSTNLGAILGNMTSIGGGSPLSGLFGTTASDAEEFIAIVNSVDFTNELVKKDHLDPLLKRHKPWLATLLWWYYGTPHSLTPWLRYSLMSYRFDYKYDDKEGNLTLWFEDPDRAEANRVLTGYVELLQERLRTRYVETANVAIKDLERQVGTTSDMLLVGQLDQLLAEQLQQLGTAELQAGFAFVVIDPPVVPDGPHSPQPLIDALMALILAPGIAGGWLLLRDRRRRRMMRQDPAPRDLRLGRRAIS